MYRERGLYVFRNNDTIRRFTYDGQEAEELPETRISQQLIDFLELDLDMLKKALNNLRAYDNDTLDFAQTAKLCGAIGIIAKDFCQYEPVYSFLLCTEFYLSTWNVNDEEELIEFKDYGIEVIQQTINIRNFFFAVVEAYCRATGDHADKLHYSCLGRAPVFECRFEEVITRTAINTKMFQMTIPELPFKRGYRFETLTEYIWYLFINAIEQDLNLSQCEYCGHFFIPKTKKKTRYCDRVRTEDGRTCKQVGPIYVRRARAKNDKIFDEYNKAINRNYKRMERFECKISDVKTGKDITYNEYADWLRDMSAARTAFYSGEISEGEFREVIHRLDQ